MSMRLLAPMSFLLALCVGCSNSSLYTENSEIEQEKADWNWIPFDSEFLRISGRYNAENADFIAFSWSGASVTIAFEGTSLETKVWTDGVLYLDVFVDGSENPISEIAIDHPGKDPLSVSVVSGLSRRNHVVTLYKRSEANLGDWYFYGLRVEGTAKIELLPQVPEHKIEFVGNSITCGGDVLAPVPGREFNPRYESSYYGYAGQSAWLLDAEAHIVCSAGHGIAINVDGSRDLLLPVVYNWTGTHSATVVGWNHETWHPDAVVINLGTNDFGSGQNDSAEFVDATVGFVRQVRLYHPEAKIVLLDGPMLTGDYMVKCRQYLDVAKATLETLGERDVYRYSFEPKGESPNGVYFHPNKAEALGDARSLSTWMRSEFGWN